MEDVLQSDRLFQLVRSQAQFQQKGLQLQEALQKRTKDLAILQAEAKERFGTDDPVQLSAIAERMRLWVQEVIKFDARAHKAVDACLGALNDGVAISQEALQELSTLAQIQQGLMDAASNNSFDVGVIAEKRNETNQSSSAYDSAFEVDVAAQEHRSTIHTSGEDAQPTAVQHDARAHVAAAQEAQTTTGKRDSQPSAARPRNVLGSVQRGLRADPALSPSKSPSTDSQPVVSQDTNQKGVAEEPIVNPLLVATGEAVIKDGQLIAAGGGDTSGAMSPEDNNQVPSATVPINSEQTPDSSVASTVGVRRAQQGGKRRL